MNHYLLMRGSISLTHPRFSRINLLREAVLGSPEFPIKQGDPIWQDRLAHIAWIEEQGIHYHYQVHDKLAVDAFGQVRQHVLYVVTLCIPDPREAFWFRMVRNVKPMPHDFAERDFDSLDGCYL